MKLRRLALSFCFGALAACGGDDHESSQPSIDGGGGIPDGGGTITTDAGASDAGSAPAFDAGLGIDCVSGTPTSYADILNACTTADKVIKNPSLPLLMIDGGLPPLP